MKSTKEKVKAIKELMAEHNAAAEKAKGFSVKAKNFKAKALQAFEKLTDDEVKLFESELIKILNP